MKKTNFGVLVYQNQYLPECSSINVGDYIQSLEDEIEDEQQKIDSP